MTIYNLFRETGPYDRYYYDTEKKEVVDLAYYYHEYFKKHPEEKRIPMFNTLPLIELPGYKELDHKGMMSYFVKEIVEDKSIRQELFYILRRHEYMDSFYEALKKHNLYQDYCDMSDDFFRQIINEWQEEHNIKI